MVACHLEHAAAAAVTVKHTPAPMQLSKEQLQTLDTIALSYTQALAEWLADDSEQTIATCKAVLSAALLPTNRLGSALEQEHAVFS
jgi:hypothetical protein